MKKLPKNDDSASEVDPTSLAETSYEGLTPERKKAVDLVSTLWGIFKPPTRMTVTEWADKYVQLPDESAMGGQYKSSKTPYVVEPQDCFTDTSVKGVVLMFASQTGKTAIMLNGMGYFIAQEPAAQLMVMPAENDVQEFSKMRLQPMFSGQPDQFPDLADTKGRDPKRTILLKQYPGGFLSLAGTNAPAKLASKPIRIVWLDEVDRFEASSKKEGDPCGIALKRMTTFWNGFFCMSSSPGIKDLSRIEKEYNSSSRGHWCLPCPSCGAFQTLEWERLDFDTSKMACACCGCLHHQYEWTFGDGVWIHEDPSNKIKGFHLSGMASPFPGVAWPLLIEEYKDALLKGKESMKVFETTRLARPYEEKYDKIEKNVLEGLKHYYDCDVPRRVVILTAGVDVQIDRLELEIVGWGPGYESWGIQYIVLPGDPQKKPVWEALAEVLNKTYTRQDGKRLPIFSMCIDSGYATQRVYDWTRPRYSRNVVATKGQGGAVADLSKQSLVGRNKNTALFMLGTDNIKSTIHARLKTEEEGPDRCHWPMEQELSDGEYRGYASDYFDQLTAEKPIPVGQTIHWEKIPSKRNEALDCRVYATAALRLVVPAYNALVKADNPKREVVVPRGRQRRTASRGVAV